jgi:methylglutaconyl-CoA hydratase
MIGELSSVFLALPDMATVRVVVVSGEGASFCAGADIQMMRRAGEATLEENRQDATALAGLFHAMNSCPQPVIARVHGAALGGGMGIVCCSDVAVAEASTRFGFTEVRLGILPAVISPFAIERIGASAARAHFVLGDRFDAAEALRIGLVHHVVEGTDALDTRVASLVKEALAAAPGASALAKQLVRDLDVPNVTSSEAVLEKTVELITERRASDEGREGLSAFLERRKPDWVPRSG